MIHTGSARPSLLSPISVLIPAYNEEAAIRATVTGIVETLRACGREFEIIVVDDGSTDRTAEEAAAVSEVRLIRHRRNKGYGAALKTATLAAKHPIVVFFDADGQFDPADILRLVAELPEADAALGDRQAGSHSPFSRRGGKKLLGWLANYMARQTIPDLNCGLRALSRRLLLDYLHLLPNGFSASTTTTLVLLKENYEVVFVPITAKKRIGKSTVRPIADGLAAALLVLRLTTLLDPFRVFSPVSLVLILGGLAWGIPYMAMRRGLSSASLFLLLSGVMIFFFGLLTDQVAALRRERRYHDRDS